MYDLSNNFGAVFTIGENNGTNMLGRDKEGMGVHSRVGTRVVCDRDAIVDDDLPAETHPGGDVAGSARVSWVQTCSRASSEVQSRVITRRWAAMAGLRPSLRITLATKCA